MILSVIIPCFNHGIYLQEAIDSVLSYTDQAIEIIIVDDGSNERQTIDKLNDLKSKKFKIIQHTNRGLAKTRNAGIASAQGKYILPLDADNKIKADYIRKSIKILENNESDIVYAKPQFFGEVSEERKFTTKEFSGSELIFGNYIDACAIFRKEVWVKNNGYDANMPYQGAEDWDFWLNSFFNGFRFKFIDEELYEYRILNNSMIAIARSRNNNNQMTNYIMGKYGVQIMNFFSSFYHKSKIYDNDNKSPLRSVIKYLYKLVKPSQK